MSLLSPASVLDHANDHVTLYNGRRAKLRLHIAVVGCGLGGLAAAFTLSKAGHYVTILESALAISEVGAGIQVSPNTSRLLCRWGLRDALDRVAVQPHALVFRRYSTGEKVGYTSWEDMEARYGAPYLHVHRADFHSLLFDLVASSPDVSIRLGATVTRLDPDLPLPRITLATGEALDFDLVVGADGIKSMIREVVVGHSVHATPTGDAAYRALVPASQIEHDPDLRPFLDYPEMTGWMAPRRHIMMYPIRAKQYLNLVLSHPDDSHSSESWTEEGSALRMREEFADFEPRVQKLLSLIPSTLKWKLMDRQPLDTWVHPGGRVVLLGDSCHPMLPYRAQGAAMAIEDAAVLGNLLSRLAYPAQIKPLVRVYEGLRLPRTAETQRSSRLNQKIFHLPDGPEQEERDAKMRAAMNGVEISEGNPNQWADRKKNDIQFGYDADEVVERWWLEEGERSMGSLDGEEPRNRL